MSILLTALKVAEVSLWALFLAGVLFIMFGSCLVLLRVWSPAETMKRFKVVGKSLQKVWWAGFAIAALAIFVAVLHEVLN